MVYILLESVPRLNFYNWYFKDCGIKIVWVFLHPFVISDIYMWVSVMKRQFIGDVLVAFVQELVHILGN